MSPILINPGELFICVSHIVAILQSKGVNLPGPSPLATSAASRLQNLPSWIARYGFVADGKDIWGYFEPRCSADSNPSDQVLIYLPAGRYFVDTFDIVLRTCIARESAEGNPLVIGLLPASGPSLLWIRPIERIEEK